MAHIFLALGAGVTVFSVVGLQMAVSGLEFDRYAKKRSETSCNHASASDKIALSVHKKPKVSPSISRFFIFIVCSSSR